MQGGYIKIPSDGTYTFFITSDDGCHAPVEGAGTAVLKAGYHEIHMRFFQASGGKALAAQIEGPGAAKQDIPPEMLSH